MDALKKEAKTPFVILVLADFSGQPVRALPKLAQRRVVTVSRESLPRVMRVIKPGFSLSVDGAGNASENHDVRFNDLIGFDRDAILSKYPPGIGERILISTEYEALRATWTGLRWLVEAAAELSNVKIQIWDVTKRELLRDLQKASEFDQSAPFKRVYEEGVGTLGGDAIGVIVGDYYLSAHPEDCQLAEQMSRVAAAAMSPVLFGVQPAFFAARRWNVLPESFDPRWFIEAGAFLKWKEFFRSEDSAYSAMLLPRWRPGEDGGALADGDRPWLHPSYLAAARAAAAMNAMDLGEVAEFLFPCWKSAETRGGTACESSGFAADFELEWEGSETARAGLARIGFTSLSAAEWRQPDALESMATAAQFADPAASVAMALLGGRIWHRCSEQARRLRNSASAGELRRKLEAWSAEMIPRAANNVPLCSTGQEGGVLAISLSWHEAPDGRIRPSVRRHYGLRDKRFAVSADSKATVVVLGEMPSSARDKSKYCARRWSPGDDYLPFEHTLIVAVRDLLNAGAAAEIEIKAKTWKDWEEEQLSSLTPDLRSLAEIRSALADVGFDAHLDERRAASLVELGSRPEALAGLLGRLEGWRSLLKDPEHAAIDVETVQETLAGWGMEEEWYGDAVQHSLSIFQKYAGGYSDNADLVSVAGLRLRIEEIDRLVFQQVREIYSAPLFRHHRRLCLAVKWLAETVEDSGIVRALGYQMPTNLKNRADGKWDDFLREVWIPSGEEGLVVALAAQYEPGLLNEPRSTILPQAGLRVFILPLEGEPPASIDDLDPGFVEDVLGAKKTVVILTGGEFLLQPARLRERKADRGFEACAGEVLEAELYASSSYQVAAAVVAAWLSGECDASTLQPELRKYGLTCRPLDPILVVTAGS